VTGTNTKLTFTAIFVRSLRALLGVAGTLPGGTVVTGGIGGGGVLGDCSAGG
jgi:hypothetical protein